MFEMKRERCRSMMGGEEGREPHQGSDGSRSGGEQKVERVMPAYKRRGGWRRRAGR